MEDSDIPNSICQSGLQVVVTKLTSMLDRSGAMREEGNDDTRHTKICMAVDGVTEVLDT